MLATGCVFGPKEDSGSEDIGIDPPQINYTTGENPDIVLDILETDETVDQIREEESVKEVDREIYVFDHQGYVIPITVRVPYTESVAKQALEYLVADGPITPKLPDGMRAVLPAGTEVDVNVTENRTAIVDFSKEFETYQAQDEKGILEALTWTLTQFNTIDNIVIWINGYPQDTMPVNNTPISKTLSRKDGINIEIAQGTYVGNSSAVTLYFKAQSPSGTLNYFVPVTRIVPKSNDLVLSTVQELIAGPSYGSGLYTDLVKSTQLIKSTVAGNKVTLDFDEQFLRYANEGSKASDNALDSLVLSLTETGKIDQIQFLVNGKSDLDSFEGRVLSQPVSRPLTVNTAGF